MPHQMRETALVLQGGGAFGAYEVGVVKRLYEEPGFRPSIFSGVSIGAINAAALAAGGNDVIARLEEMWDRFAVEPIPFVPDLIQRWLPLFGNPHFFQPRYDYSDVTSWTSFYSTSPLKRLLEEFVDFDRINDKKWKDRPRLVVTATNLLSGEVESFDNYEAIITVDHVMASSSLPPAFPMTCVNGKFYWDGGLFANNPLSDAVCRLKSNDEVTERVIVFVELMPNRGNVPQNLLDVFGRITDILYSSKLVSDVETLEKVNQLVDILQAVDKQLPEDSPIRAMEGYDRLSRYKKIDRFVRIINSESGWICAPLDFSRETVKRRIEAGYHDAERAFRDLNSSTRE